MGGGDSRSKQYMFIAAVCITAFVLFLASQYFNDEEYDASEGECTVTFKLFTSGTGTLSHTSITVPYGSTISKNNNTITIGSYVVTATPNPDTAQFKYTWQGWSNGTGTITADRTITAVINQQVQKYTITFKVNNSSWGSVSQSSIEASYGSKITKDRYGGLTIGDTEVYAHPTASSSQYEYSFSSWSNASGTITGDRTITANFTQSLRYYTIKVESNDTSYGIIDNSQVSVAYGTSISYTGNTLKVGSTTFTATPSDDTAEYHYFFDSWSNTATKVTGARTIKAVFDRAVQEYEVSFITNEASWGTISPSSVLVPYGSAVSLSNNTLTIGTATVTATPSPDDSSYTYSFSSWQNVPTTITSATTITAIFTATQAGHTVQYYYNGSKISGYDEFVPHGGTIIHTTYSDGDLIFCGWYTDSSLAPQYLFNNSTPVNQNYILYAQMAEPITFTSSPVADATITYLSWAGMVLFDSVGSNSPYRVVWDFGDGTTSTDRVAYHLYSDPGTYTVKLSAYNYYGDVDVKEYQIIVADDDAIVVDSNVMYIGIALAIAALVSIFVVTRVL